MTCSHATSAAAYGSRAGAVTRAARHGLPGTTLWGNRFDISNSWGTCDRALAALHARVLHHSYPSDRNRGRREDRVLAATHGPPA